MEWSPGSYGAAGGRVRQAVSEPLVVVLATGNAGKAREFDRLLAPVAHGGPLPAGVTLPPETGTTFAANARLKAEVGVRRPWGQRRPCWPTTRVWRSARSADGRACCRPASPATTASDERERGEAPGRAGGQRPTGAARFVCSLC